MLQKIESHYSSLYIPLCSLNNDTSKVFTLSFALLFSYTFVKTLNLIKVILAKGLLKKINRVHYWKRRSCLVVTTYMNATLFFLFLYLIISRFKSFIPKFISTFNIIYFSFNPDPRIRNTFWTLAIGGAFTAMPVWTICQPAVQRFQAAKSLKESKK